MDDRERQRLQLAGEVAKLLKNRSRRDALPPLTSDRTIPFVVGLEDDTIRAIAERAATLGGDAHIIVPTELAASGVSRVRILRITGGVYKQIADLDESRECAVEENSTLGMLMTCIEVGQQLTYHTYDTETIIRFINDSVQPIPA
jgi:hypothetical protein